MTTTILHSDVIGTSYQHSRFDATRLRATRKFIVKSDRTDIDDEDTSTSNTIIAELTATTSTDGTNILTPLGPRYIDEDGSATDNEIVHPDNNFLPLQTVNVQKLGDERYLVTAEYFIVPGVGGGSSGGGVVDLQLRVEAYAKRTYRFNSSDTTSYWTLPGAEVAGGFQTTDLPSGVSPESYAKVVMVPQVKMQIPFVSITNPFTYENTQKVGGTNQFDETIGNIGYAAGSLRFDGIQMDAYGGYETSGGQTYKYRGFFEFTARQDQFKNYVAIPTPNTQQYTLREVYDGANPEAQWTLAGLAIPGL